MRAIIILVISILAFSSCQNKKTEKKEENIYAQYNLRLADSVVINAFENKDIVFLGEFHRRKEHTEFVNGLIPILYENDIRIIFSEFANYLDTELSDSILTAPDYSEIAARRIIHNSEWDWAYQEYVELYKAAWKFNKTLKPGQKSFRIIGLQPNINYSAIQSPHDWDSPEKRTQYWNESDSTTWVAIIEKEAILRNEKALVYCGCHHAFSKFHHPIMYNGKFIRFETDREGTQLYNKYPDRVSTILLHSFWSGKESYTAPAIIPFDGILDSICKLLPKENNKYGFEIKKSKLGNLIDSTSTYSNGRDTVKLKDICDGYIVLKPVCELSLVSLITDFIDESNFKRSIIQAYPYNFTNDWTIQSMNDSLKVWYENEIEILNNAKKNCN